MSNLFMEKILSSRFLKYLFAFSIIMFLSSFITLNMFVFAKTTKEYSVTSGFDASGGGTGTAFDSNDLSALSKEGGSGMVSDNNWSGAYNEEKYLEFIFSPNVPSSANIKKVEIVNVYKRIGIGELNEVKLEIWDGIKFKDKNLSLDGSDKFIEETINIKDIANTPSLVNGLKVRFLASTNGELTKTEHDFIQIKVEYQLPLAIENKSIITDEDTATTTILTITDSEMDRDDPIIFATTSSPQNGIVLIKNNELTYTPNKNYIGTDSFKYIANDGVINSNEAVISVTINSVNDAPTLNPISSTSTPELQELKFTPIAEDSEEDAITFSLTPTSTGATINQTTGEFKWTPTEEQGPGTYEFTITVADTSNATSSQSFTITVTEVNTKPTITSIALTTDKNTPTSTTLTATDTDIPENIITFATTSNPTNGTTTIKSNQLTYTPNKNYIGTDSFKYIANDGTDNSDENTITITINDRNFAPISISTSTIIDEDTPTIITFIAEDPESDTLTFATTSNPKNGILSSISGNTIEYTPNINFYGTDSFEFKANDGIADSNIATTTIIVNNVNDAPIVQNQTATKNVDNNISILISVSDPDAEDKHIASITKNPTLGTITAIDGTKITYKPNGTAGTDSFEFKVNDGTADSNIATTTVNLTHGAFVQLGISANPEILDVGSSSVITVAAQDKYGNTILSDNSSQIELRFEADKADREVVLEPSLLTLTNGIATATLTKSSSGNVKITASKEGLKKVQVKVKFIKLEITKTEQTKTNAIADDKYENGWEWVLDVTVPSNETGLSMKFSDWLSNTTTTIAAANNIRFYSPQSYNTFNEGTAINITGSNIYGNLMFLNKDLDASAIGRQIKLYINAKIPKEMLKASGEFSIMYKILSEEFLVLKSLLQQ